MVGQMLGLAGRLLGFGEYILDFQGFKNAQLFYNDDSELLNPYSWRNWWSKLRFIAGVLDTQGRGGIRASFALCTLKNICFRKGLFVNTNGRKQTLKDTCITADSSDSTVGWEIWRAAELVFVAQRCQSIFDLLSRICANAPAILAWTLLCEKVAILVAIWNMLFALSVLWDK
jgi:hypothetical protein